MHGTVMAGLEKFIRENEGELAWRDVRDTAGVDRVTYSVTVDYPDTEFLQIYGTFVEEYGCEDEEQLQRQFGNYLFPMLVEIYERIYFEDDWGPLEMINSIEETIHQSLKQRRHVEFTPPELETERLEENIVVIKYRSDRHLCAVAKGLIDGVAEHYDTTLEIEETQCMKEGADYCRIVVIHHDE